MIVIQRHTEYNSSMAFSLPLAVTAGDPAGIAAEITLKAWAMRHFNAVPPFYVLGDPDFLAQQAIMLGLDVPQKIINQRLESCVIFPDALPIVPVPLSAPVIMGVSNTRHAPAVLASINQAVADVQQGEAAGIVTNPIQKGTLYAAGFPHGGHTEYLGALCGTEQNAVMMLVTADLKVVLATIHVPIKKVAASLSKEKIIFTARAAIQALKQDFGIPQPRLAVAALNPHAGEEGAIGREEIEIIQPAVDTLRLQGFQVENPAAADTLFHSEARKNYDAVLCMYHDQALIPLKTLDFWGGVNVTLGLPIVRTSPDHGTGLGIAGQNKARPDSLIAALKMAAQIAKARGIA
jgi:4-hydroxythreonine-4-phosphate dehydrogenase